jgi:hypothetical protein
MECELDARLPPMITVRTVTDAERSLAVCEPRRGRETRVERGIGTRGMKCLSFRPSTFGSPTCQFNEPEEVEIFGVVHVVRVALS